MQNAYVRISIYMITQIRHVNAKMDIINKLQEFV